MQTNIADERMLIFKDQLTTEQAQEIAWSKKIDAFGTISKFTSLLSKPQDSDFELLYSEHRYQPIWHVKGAFSYVYDRQTTYQWPVSGNEVKNITVNGQDYTVADGHIALTAMDHCTEEEQLEVIVDGLTGEKQSKLAKYLTFIASVADEQQLEQMNKDNIIMVPPKARVSALVNEILASSVKVIQADKIFEEKIEISNVDLYYRPVYAFQFKWLSKQKDIVIDVDGLTGEVSYGHNLFKQYLGKAVDINFLFDVGADAAGMILPGGSIAVKVAKRYIDSKKK
jgi:hypothetical protein